MTTTLYKHEEDLNQLYAAIENSPNIELVGTVTASDGTGKVVTVKHDFPADLYYLGLREALDFGIDNLNDLIKDHGEETV